MTNSQEISVMDFLSDGFGVEDIAIKLQVTIKEVRKLVDDLRSSGLLLQVLRVED